MPAGLRFCLLLLCGLLVVDFGRGVFPFSTVEGDEQSLINGANEMVRGPDGDLNLRYDYPLQPGTYAVIIAVHRLTGADLAVCYYATSAAAAAACIGLAAWLAVRLTGVAFSVALLLTLLCQEMLTAGFYANSSTLGGLLGLVALLLASRSQGWVAPAMAGLLFAAAGWCRLDALVLTPAILVILARRVGFAKALGQTSVAAVACVLGLTLLFRACGLSGAQVWRSGTVDTGSLGYLLNLTGLGQATSATIALTVVVGLVRSLARRQFWVGLLFISVGIPTLILYGGTLWSTKYYYYLVFVLVVVAAQGVAGLAEGFSWSQWRRPRALLLLGLAALGVLETGSSVLSSGPGVRHFTPPPALVTVRLKNRPVRPIEWVIGAGELVPNSDGFRVRGGLAFVGESWHQEKVRALVEAARIRAFLVAHPNCAILTSTYVSATWTVGMLRQLGYTRIGTTPAPDDPASHLDAWKSVRGTCQFGWINVGDAEERTMAGFTGLASSVPLILVNDLGPSQARRLLAARPTWRLLSPRDDGILAIYAPDPQIP